MPGWAVTAEATAGSVANMHMIRDGKAQMALTQCDTAYDAIKGLDKFKDKPVESRTLCVVYPNLVHFVTMEGTGINKLSDIKGKRISTSAPVSGSEVMALRIIDELGLKVADIKRERLSPAESTNAMKDGKLDGYFFNGGPPVAAITDLAATQGVKIKLIPDCRHWCRRSTRSTARSSRASEIKAKSYPNQDAAVPVIAIWNILVVPASMKDDQAYTIIKTLWENHADLVATHKAVDRHDAGEPEAGQFVGAVPSRRDEVLRREGHQAVVSDGSTTGRGSRRGGSPVPFGDGKTMTVQAELLSDEERRKVEELIEQEEGGVHKFAGWWGTAPHRRLPSP